MVTTSRTQGHKGEEDGLRFHIIYYMHILPCAYFSLLYYRNFYRSYNCSSILPVDLDGGFKAYFTNANSVKYRWTFVSTHTHSTVIQLSTRTGGPSSLLQLMHFTVIYVLKLFNFIF
jgi:hypothetical protein